MKKQENRTNSNLVQNTAGAKMPNPNMKDTKKISETELKNAFSKKDSDSKKSSKKDNRKH